MSLASVQFICSDSIEPDLLTIRSAMHRQMLPFESEESECHVVPRIPKNRSAMLVWVNLSCRRLVIRRMTTGMSESRSQLSEPPLSVRVLTSAAFVKPLLSAVILRAVRVTSGISGSRGNAANVAVAMGRVTRRFTSCVDLFGSTGESVSCHSRQ